MNKQFNTDLSAVTTAEQSDAAQVTTSSQPIGNTMLCDVDVYEQALKLFVSEDDLRPQFLEPFVIDDFAIATDAHQLIFFDKIFWQNQKEYKGTKKETVLNVLPKERNEMIELSTDKINQAINAAPLIDEMKTITKRRSCDACDGEGVVDYEFSYGRKTYELEEDCPVCEGEGQSIQETKMPTGNKISDLNKAALLKGFAFSLSSLDKLVKVATLFNEEYLLLTNIGNHGAATFKIKNVEVMMMPVLTTSDSDMIVCHIA